MTDSQKRNVYFIEASIGIEVKGVISHGFSWNQSKFVFRFGFDCSNSRFPGTFCGLYICEKEKFF
jgi:hypothetical protein